MRILKQCSDRLGQPDAFQSRFLDHHCGSVPRQGFGIDALMIVGRARKWNKDCGFSRRRNFGDRAGARAADYQSRRGRRPPACLR